MGTSGEGMVVEAPNEGEAREAVLEAQDEQEQSLRSLETLLFMSAIAHREGEARKREADDFVQKNVPDWHKIDGRVPLTRRLVLRYLDLALDSTSLSNFCKSSLWIIL